MKGMAAVLLALAGASFSPVFAQSNGNGDTSWDRIVLTDKAGNVMTSVNGAPYGSANTGDLLQVGEHMMLADAQVKPRARVEYQELNDKGEVIRRCIRDYRDPNTYIVDASCHVAAAWASTGVKGAGVSAGVIAGAAVIGGVLIGNGEKTPPGPLSTGVRHF